jgi:hypothetical protein
MNRAGPPLLVIVLYAILASPLATEAQPPTRIYRIGVLTFAPSPDLVDREACLKALRTLGHVAARISSAKGIRHPARIRHKETLDATLRIPL